MTGRPKEKDYERLLEVYEANKQSYYSNSKDELRKTPISIDRFFNAITRGKVIQQDGSIEFLLNMPEIESSSMGQYLTSFKKYLRLASRGAGLPGTLSIESVEGKPGYYRLIWAKELPEANRAKRQDVTHRFQRIVVVGSLRRTEFDCEMMRGMHSMANELGIEIVDRLQWGGHSPADKETLLQFVNANNLNSDNDALVIRNRALNRIRAEIAEAKGAGFRVVSIESNSGDVRQETGHIGLQLAQQCILDLEQNPDERRVVLVQKNPNDDISASTKQFRESFEQAISNHKRKGFRIELEYLDLGPNLYQPDLFGESQNYFDSLSKRLEQTRESVKDQISIDRLAAAVLMPDVTYLKAAWEILRQSGGEHVKLYAERLSSSLLDWLSQPSSPLAAICGTDPYYFGRFAARAASCRSTSVFTPTIPVLITKAEAASEDRSIISADRVPPLFKGVDVRLDSSEFAWFPWMKQACPNSFGPNLYESRKTGI